MLIAMSSINLSIDWESFKSHATVLDQIDRLTKWAMQEGHYSLVETLNSYYFKVSEDSRRKHLAVIK
jgi:myo-inositol-1-phosphate synthase